MSTIFNLIKTYPFIVASVVSLLLTIFMIVKFWDKVSFWWLNVLYSLPVFGKLERLSRKTHIMGEWFSSEKKLCDDYYRYYVAVGNKDSNFYKNCTSYLGRIQETGRDNLHFIGWFLIIALVFIEAYGFSYVLAPYMALDGSENERKLLAYGIAFMISVILVAFTHGAGAEAHKNGLINKSRIWWTQDSNPDKPSLKPSHNEINIENNSLDEKSPDYVQILNRLSGNALVTPSYNMMVLTVILVTCIAIGATWVRMQVLEAYEHDETIGCVDDDQNGPFDMSKSIDLTDELPDYGSTGGNGVISPEIEKELKSLDGIGFPDELSEDTSNANEKSCYDLSEIRKDGAFATNILLAVFFVFLQIWGVYMGLKHGFSGAESSKARNATRKFDTAEEFYSYYQRKKENIANIAQEKLQYLQGALCQQPTIDPKNRQLLQNTSDRTFIKYVQTLKQTYDNNK